MEDGDRRLVGCALFSLLPRHVCGRSVVTMALHTGFVLLMLICLSDKGLHEFCIRGNTDGRLFSHRSVLDARGRMKGSPK